MSAGPRDCQPLRQPGYFANCWATLCVDNGKPFCCKGSCGCQDIVTNNKKGTSEVNYSAGRPSLVVTTAGRGVVAHVGARLLAELADGLGLTQGILTVATLMPPRGLLSS